MPKDCLKVENIIHYLKEQKVSHSNDPALMLRDIIMQAKYWLWFPLISPALKLGGRAVQDFKGLVLQ
jgi:hypothetical protein